MESLSTCRSQLVHFTWWTAFSTSHTLSKASTQIIFGALGLIILPRFHSRHRLAHSCLLVMFPIARTMCIHACCAPYACNHLERWVHRLFCLSYLDSIYIWGFPNHMSIILLHSRQSSKLLWCVPHHHAGVMRNTHFRALKRCSSSTSISNLFRKSSTSLNPSYVGISLTSVVTQHRDSLWAAYLYHRLSWYHYTIFTFGSSLHGSNLIICRFWVRGGWSALLSCNLAINVG